MALPVSVRSFGVLVPDCLLSWKTVNHNIGPAIPVKIIGICQETLRVGIVDAERAFEARDYLLCPVGLLAFETRVSRPNLMALLKIRSFIPKRTGHHIHFAVPVKIRDIRTLSPELVGSLDFFERDVFGMAQC